MSSTIPTEVDVVIIGTNLTNSIVAAACSRIGKSVLHLDKNNYYGDDWASFTLQQLIDWAKARHNKQAGDIMDPVPEELINKSRMFCIDLTPRFLFSNGPMVELLVKSNVARYHEFKNNIRILCMIDNDIHVMPCRRNEVFTSPLLPNLADKRKLMKFIESCLKEGEGEGEADVISELNSDKPIEKLLEERGLSSNLREYIINSIAMVKPSDSTREACQSIRKFMIATERYGRSPFLFPLYGCGEFPQSFCRLSAVFGGVYCLNTRIDYVKVPKSMPPPEIPDKLMKKEKFSVKFQACEHEVKCEMVLVDHKNAISLDLISNLPGKSMNRLARAILITKESIVPHNDHDRDLVSFLRIPLHDADENIVFLLEFNSSALVCPKNLNLVYLWTKATSEKAEADLSPIIERVFSKSDPESIMWKFFYHQLVEGYHHRYQQHSSNSPNSDSHFDDRFMEKPVAGLHITNQFCDSIDYASNIREAEELFRKMCPNEEFLPRAPDPEEIISI